MNNFDPDSCNYSIPKELLTIELILCLLDRYISATETKCSELADIFYSYSDDDELFFSERQIRFWLKRERSIPKAYFNSIANFICSDEFISIVPDVKYLFQNQKTAREAGVLLSKIRGRDIHSKDVLVNLIKSDGYWQKIGLDDRNKYSWLWLKMVVPNGFSIIHVFHEGRLYSGFLFVINSERVASRTVELNSEVYITCRHNRKKVLFENFDENEARRQEKYYSKVFPNSPREKLNTVTQLENSVQPNWLVYEEEIHVEGTIFNNSVSRFHYSMDDHERNEFFIKFIDRNSWNVIPNE